MRERVSVVLESLGYPIKRISDGRVTFRYCEQVGENMIWKEVRVKDEPTIIVSDEGGITTEEHINNKKGIKIGIAYALSKQLLAYNREECIETTKLRCVEGVLVRLLADGYSAVTPISCYSKIGDNTDKMTIYAIVYALKAV